MPRRKGTTMSSPPEPESIPLGTIKAEKGDVLMYQDDGFVLATAEGCSDGVNRIAVPITDKDNSNGKYPVPINSVAKQGQQIVVEIFGIVHHGQQLKIASKPGTLTALGKKDNKNSAVARYIYEKPDIHYEDIEMGARDKFERDFGSSGGEGIVELI